MPSVKHLLVLSGLYDKSIDELLCRDTVSAGPAIRIKVPIISWVQAGEAMEAIDLKEPGFSDEYAPCAVSHSDSTYALRVHGHSMTSTIGRSYPEGRIIICDPELRGGASSGQRVIARILDTGNVTFKELVIEDGLAWLRSLNEHPQYTPTTDEFEILAVVIASHIPE